MVGLEWGAWNGGPGMGGLVWGAWNGGPGMGGLVWGAWNGGPGMGGLVWGPGIVRNVPNPDHLVNDVEDLKCDTCSYNKTVRNRIRN